MLQDRTIGTMADDSARIRSSGRGRQACCVGDAAVARDRQSRRGAAIVLSWAALAAMAIGTAQFALPAESGPGDSLLHWLPDLPVPDWAGRFFALCLTPVATSGSLGFLFMWLMWTLMAVAMMLPSAAPMIRTYCEIADTARAKGEAAVHPLILVAGYLAVWIGASAVFAGVSLVVQSRTGGARRRLRGRCRTRHCRALPVQRTQAGLPEEMPQPVRHPVLALEQPTVAHLPAWHGAGRLVPRLLLGADARDVRGRHHEHILDGADRTVYHGGKTNVGPRLPLGLPARYCLYGRRRCY